MSVQDSTPEHSAADPNRAPAGSAAWDHEAVADQYDTLSSHLSDVAATDPVMEAADHAQALMRLRPGARALDVGCGTGLFLRAMAEAVRPGGLAVGVDHAPAFLEEARSRLREAGLDDVGRFEVADAHRLPFADQFFDAAHVERVLIHLDDPPTAVRELCRVVRPGGWVVAVEPDLTGLRVDHADVEAMQRIVEGFCATIRHPAIGLALDRLMAEAGLIDRRIRLVTELEREYPPEVAVHYERAAEAEVDAGRLTRERAGAALAFLRAAGAAGHFVSYSSMFVVAGRVPS